VAPDPRQRNRPLLVVFADPRPRRRVGVPRPFRPGRNLLMWAGIRVGDHRPAGGGRWIIRKHEPES
jgi:hypothetical protein